MSENQNSNAEIDYPLQEKSDDTSFDEDSLTFGIKGFNQDVKEEKTEGTYLLFYFW